LTEAEDATKTAGAAGPTNLAFRAMAQQRAGWSAAARATLKRLRELMHQPRWANDAEARASAAEAEETLALAGVR
jgi:hypothetical protein